MNHHDDYNNNSLGASSITTSRRRRRRSRSSNTDGNPNNDPYSNNMSIPWQAMKRLRVDAAQVSSSTMAMTTDSVDDDEDDDDSLFHNNNDDTAMQPETTSRTSSTKNTDDIRDVSTSTTTTHPITTTTTTTRYAPQRQPPKLPSNSTSGNYKYDSYHCYQRHQHQETGQDTDGWSSPEQYYTQPSPSSYDRTTRSTTTINNGTTTTASSRDNHRNHPLNGCTTPSVLHRRHDDNDDDNDDMDYQNVNHILGNLHFERQQRMAQPPPSSSRPENDTWNNHNTNSSSRVQPMNESSNIHDSSYNSFSHMTAAALSLTTLPPTPLNTRMLRQQQFWNGSQHQPMSQSSLSSAVYNEQFQTPPSKPTKRKVVQLYTSSKLG